MGLRTTRRIAAYGARNMLLCASCVLAVGLPLMVLIHLFSGYGLMDSWIIGMVTLMVPVLIWTGSLWFLARVQRSTLLLDAGPHPAKLGVIAASSLLLLLGVIGLADDAGDTTTSIAEVGMHFGQFVTGVVMIVLGSGRLQFYANGLWCYSGLMKWSAIESWELEDRTLFLTSSRRFLGFLGKGGVPIPASQREAVQRIMRERCPEQERARFAPAPA